MKISENVIKSLQLANNSNLLSDSTYKSLLENCFTVLIGKNEPHNTSKLYNSKPDLIKELYAALLSVTAEFVRNNQTKDNVSQFLTNQCNFNAAKSGGYLDFYERNLVYIEAALVNIGNYLPHVTDITWKIDYVIKSSNLDRSDGPLFRIGLQTEKSVNNRKSVELVNFTCTSQELQDLVYKLKDAVRLCQKIAAE